MIADLAIYNKALAKTISTIDIPAGIYFLHIYDGNNILTQQLVIKELNYE
jgi:hypothetical protein